MSIIQPTDDINHNMYSVKKMGGTQSKEQSLTRYQGGMDEFSEVTSSPNNKMTSLDSLYSIPEQSQSTITELKSISRSLN